MKSIRVGNKVVGQFAEGKLVKKGPQAVLFRIYDGFGVAEDVFGLLPGLKTVEVHYEGKVYTATRESYLASGISHTQRGYETQLVLPRRLFAVTDPQQTALKLDGVHK